jgi:hypothetical protein
MIQGHCKLQHQQSPAQHAHLILTSSFYSSSVQFPELKLKAVLNIGISISTLQEITLLNPHQVYEVSLDGTSDKAEVTF